MMNLTSSSAILAFAPPTQSGQQAPVWTSLVPLVLLVIVFYVALIRPQQKSQRTRYPPEGAPPRRQDSDERRHRRNSGYSQGEDGYTCSADSKLEISKSSVGEIMERSGGEATQS
jgi:hypothetical protein